MYVLICVLYFLVIHGGQEKRVSYQSNMYVCTEQKSTFHREKNGDICANRQSPHGVQDTEGTGGV